MKFGETMAYIPDSGDIVWVMFNPQAGHEQAGHRPALGNWKKLGNRNQGSRRDFNKPLFQRV